MNSMSIIPISLIVACDKKGGIAKDGNIPWHYPQELKYFSKITTKTQDPTQINAIIMGRKTWDTLPKKPLPNRINIIISSKTESTSQMNMNVCVKSIESAIEYINSQSQIQETFVIGGESIYKEFITNYHKYIHRLYYTEIHNDFLCDQFFPIEWFDNHKEYTKSLIQKEYNIQELTYYMYEKNKYI
jgi:dihydrofolate reductase